ncbi:hypothetical protein [Mesorhizobium sp. WSM3868]|nr:hypothetical protein [Mesorhizobium sp. WSM3868]
MIGFADLLTTFEMIALLDDTFGRLDPKLGLALDQGNRAGRV